MSQTKAQLISDLVQALNFTGTSSAPANGMYLSAANTISLSANSNPALTLDLNQKILIGHTSSRDVFKETALQISGTNGDRAGLSIYSLENGNSGPNLILGHSKNGNKVTDGTILGDITFVGHDNTDLNSRASIIRSIMTADGADNSLYADLVLFTKRNAGGYPDETLRLDSAGNMGLGITPDTQGANVDSLQIGSVTNLYNETSDDYTILGNNVYFDGSNNKYIKAQESSRLLQNAGEFTFQQAASGSADGNITYTTPLKIRSTGQLAITKANDGVVSGALQINTTLANYGTIQVRDSNQANIAALQVENANDGTNETNKVIRSVNLGSTNWANAAYHAKEHKFRISGETDAENVVLINTTGVDIASAKLLTTGRANIQKGLRTSPTMLVGANDGGSGMNNNSSKHVNICCPQYLSDTQTGGFRLLSGYAGDGTNYCYLGGSDDNITGTATHPKNATQIRVFTSATATGNGVERIRVDSSGRVSIQGAATRAHLEVRSSGGTNTMLTAVFGANEGGTTGALSDDTDKGCRIGIQHYDTDALPFAWISAASGNTANSINMGGGTSLMNAATAVGIYTASNTTTATGIKRFMVESDGTVHKYLDATTIQASFGGSGQVNGITAVPAMAATPFVVGRDTGSTRSAHFGGHLKFDSGYGIDFSATNDAPISPTSEILADYEEGTWAPTLHDASGNNSTFGTVTNANYTRIGNTVRLSMRAVNMQTTGMVSGNAVYVKGLPYNTSQYNYGTAWIRSFNDSVWGPDACLVFAICDTNQIFFQGDNGANAGAIFTWADVNHNSTDCWFTIVYKV